MSKEAGERTSMLEHHGSDSDSNLKRTRSFVDDHVVPAETDLAHDNQLVIGQVVAEDQAAVLAPSLAAKVATLSPTALPRSKQATNEIESLNLRSGYQMEQKVTVLVRVHPHSKETLAAFRDHRVPVYADCKD